MLIDFEFAFYAVMVGSIVFVFWLEALIPLEDRGLNYEHLARNFSLWLISFYCADYLAGYYLIDIQALIQQQDFGVFYWFPLPGDWLLIVVGVLLVDLADYAYHRLSHRVHFLWRLHAVHHTDKQLDISTSLRGHPVGLILSNFWKFGVILAFGCPLWVIGFRELIIFPLIFLQHANVKIPEKLESFVGKVLVTPVIHRVHHSIVRAEHDSNYGEGLIIWDKLFGSYRKPWAARPDTYGVENFEAEKYQSIDGMLLTPLYISGRSAKKD